MSDLDARIQDAVAYEWSPAPLRRALREVLELHFPIGPDGDEECSECMTDFHTPYPCRTVKAIAEEMVV